MINYIYGYVIFAITTGITSYFTLYRPTLVRLASEYDMEPDNNIISIIKYISLATLTAPAILIQTLRGCTEDYFTGVVECIEEDEEG